MAQHHGPLIDLMDEDPPDDIQNKAEIALPKGVEPILQKKLQLTDLSPELFGCVLDYLDWTGWMHSLLLVSRKLYDLTLPRLYRHLEWTMYTTEEGNGANDYKMLQMLNPDNPGLNCVRLLSLYDGHEAYRSPDDMFEYPEAAMLVHLLPKNILTNFEWLSWNRMPANIYRTLLFRQQSLTSIELNWSDEPISQMVQLGSRSLLDAFKKVERFQVMPGPNEPLPQVSWDFFRNHPDIRSLYLDFSHMQRENDDREKDLLRTSNGALQGFFKGLDTSIAVLKSLNLTEVDLHGPHDNMMAAIDFKALSELHIYKCDHTEDFLAALHKRCAGHPLRLTYFCIYHARRWQPPDPAGGNGLSNRLVVEVNTLLGSNTDTLEEFWMCLRGYDRLPDVSNISGHGKTLKWVAIDVRKQKGPWSINYSIDQWSRLCASLNNLRRLDTTVNMPKLEILGINNWPFPMGTDVGTYNEFHESYGDFNKAAYTRLCATLANDIQSMRRSDAHNTS
ncbi:MAG: hypothetical protein LQ352_007684 [Teloschistes flavicans]|nr:MAG: hypothetical protein LQ352_007684 [Teloschistes flavicans]